MEGLNTTNALMKEDLSIARGSLAQLQDENDSLRSDRGIPTHAQQQTSEREVGVWVYASAVNVNSLR